MITQLVCKGIIREEWAAEAHDAVFIGDMGEPLAKFFADEIQDKEVSVRYWIADKERAKSEIQEAFIKRLSGCVDAEFEATYSDVTGYLWTDENLKIGGHDLLAELQSNVGKYVYLEIDVH